MVTGTPWRDNWVIKWAVLGPGPGPGLGLRLDWNRDWDWGWDWRHDDPEPTLHYSPLTQVSSS